MRPTSSTYAAATLALAVLLAAFPGCALSRGRKGGVSPRETLAAASQSSSSLALQACELPTLQQAANPPQATAIALASHLAQIQPEEVPAPAAPPSSADNPITLEQLERLAEERHPKLLAAVQEIEAAHGRTWQAGRMPNPSVGASSPQFAGSDSQYNVFVSQDIPTGGKLRLASAAAAEEIDQAELVLSRTRFDVLTSVRRHFYAALVAQEREKILQQQVQTIGRSVATARRRFEAGEGTKTDVMLLEVDLQKAEAALAGAQTELAAQRRQLAAAVGSAELALAKLAGNLESNPPLGDLDALPERVAASHTQAAIAAAEIRRQQILVDRAYAEPKPTFNVQGGYQRQVGPPQDQGILQLTMSVPLWDRNWGGIQAAEAQAMKAQAELQRIETELASQAAAARGRYLSAAQRATKYRAEILPKTKEASDLATRLYGEGEADFQSLLHAQEAHSEAQLQYLDALADLWQAAIEIADLLQLERFP